MGAAFTPSLESISEVTFFRSKGWKTHIQTHILAQTDIHTAADILKEHVSLKEQTGGKTWKSTGEVWTQGERGEDRGQKRGEAKRRKKARMQKSLNAK